MQISDNKKKRREKTDHRSVSSATQQERMSIQEADELFEAKEYKKEHEVLTKLYAAEPENVEVIWRLSRSYFSLHEDVQDKKEKQDLLNKGLELIRKGLALNDKHWATHKWFAVCFVLLIPSLLLHSITLSFAHSPSPLLSSLLSSSHQSHKNTN